MNARLKAIADSFLLSPADLAAYHKASAVLAAEESFLAASKGHETPSPWQNGCKTRAALVRKRRAELAAIVERPAESFLDVWNDAVDAKYKRLPFNADIINTLSDKGNGECRSIRQQTIELLTDAGFTLDAGSNCYVPPVD